MKTKISNIGKIVTWNPRKSIIDEIKHHQILIEDGKIIQIAKEVSGAEIEIDADNALITPGFIDSHTHPIFMEIEVKNLECELEECPMKKLQ